MSVKTHKYANLNIQGGESLFHPKIIDILKYINQKKSKFNWYMGVAIITNAVVGKNQWKHISQYLDYFTISFHAESTAKQQKLVKDNILYLQSIDKNFHVSVMMHPKYWDACVDMCNWCKQNNIQYNARQIDHHWLDMRFNYNADQSEYLIGRKITTKDKILYGLAKGLNLSSTGRACCGGNKLCTGNNQTEYVEGNNFKNWYCSVAEQFLYIRQNTGEVFTNKDCKMNYNNKVGPIGFLSDTESIIKKAQIHTPIICKKSSCWCGLCAPKAKNLELFNKIYQS
jgi:hypothetical protein